MAYRAAAAEKAAPAAGGVGGGPGAGEKGEEQPTAQIVEKVAEANPDGKGEALENEERVPEKEGAAGQETIPEDGDFEGEAWSPEAGVETGEEEGADIIGGEHVPEGAVDGKAGAEQAVGAVEGETPAEAGEQGPVETAPTEAEQEGPTEEAAKDAVLASEAEVEQAVEQSVEEEAMHLIVAEVARAAVLAEGPGTVEQEEQAGGEDDGDDLDFLDAEGVEDGVDEGHEGGIEHESVQDRGLDLNADPADEVE